MLYVLTNGGTATHLVESSAKRITKAGNVGNRNRVVRIRCGFVQCESFPSTVSKTTCWVHLKNKYCRALDLP